MDGLVAGVVGVRGAEDHVLGSEREVLHHGVDGRGGVSDEDEVVLVGAHVVRHRQPGLLVERLESHSEPAVWVGLRQPVRCQVSIESFSEKSCHLSRRHLSSITVIGTEP